MWGTHYRPASRPRHDPERARRVIWVILIVLLISVASIIAWGLIHPFHPAVLMAPLVLAIPATRAAVQLYRTRPNQNEPGGTDQSAQLDPVP